MKTPNRDSTGASRANAEGNQHLCSLRFLFNFLSGVDSGIGANAEAEPTGGDRGNRGNRAPRLSGFPLRLLRLLLFNFGVSVDSEICANAVRRDHRKAFN